MFINKQIGKQSPSPLLHADGSVLCAVGYEDGQVRVYALSLSLSWGSEFTLASILATEVPRTSTYPGMLHLSLSLSLPPSPSLSPSLSLPLSLSLSLSLLCFVIVSIILCPVDRLTHLVMLPLPDGCVLHACYNGELSLITHF